MADVSAYGEFTLTGDFKDDPVRLDNRNSDGWRALAETLRAFVLRDSRKPLDTGVTGSTGLLTFPNRQKTLRPGLYLLLGESFVSGGYSYTVEPSLISCPALTRPPTPGTMTRPSRPSMTASRSRPHRRTIPSSARS